MRCHHGARSAALKMPYIYERVLGVRVCAWQTLQPPISTATSLASPPLLQFGFSVAVHADTVVIGCPGQPDASKGSVPTGAAFVYDRSVSSNHYEYRQVCGGVWACTVCGSL